MLNEKWLKSETALNVAEVGTDTIKEKESWTGDTSQNRTDELEKMELLLRIKKLEQDTADKSNC